MVVALLIFYISLIKNRGELLKALQYYEVTLSWQRKANKNIIAEIKRLLIEKGRQGD